jgi:hypothetical protein
MQSWVGSGEVMMAVFVASGCPVGACGAMTIMATMQAKMAATMTHIPPVPFSGGRREALPFSNDPEPVSDMGVPCGNASG